MALGKITPTSLPNRGLYCRQLTTYVSDISVRRRLSSMTKYCFVRLAPDTQESKRSRRPLIQLCIWILCWGTILPSRRGRCRLSAVVTPISVTPWVYSSPGHLPCAGCAVPSASPGSTDPHCPYSRGDAAARDRATHWRSDFGLTPRSRASDEIRRPLDSSSAAASRLNNPEYLGVPMRASSPQAPRSSSQNLSLSLMRSSSSPGHACPAPADRS